MSKFEDLLLATINKENDKVAEFEIRIDDAVDRIKKQVHDSKAVNDAYGNSLLSIGNKDKVSAFDNYTFTNDTLNWPLWLALYNESWVFRRAIDKPAQDEIRCGITLKNCSKEAEVQRMLKNYYDDLIQLLSWGGLSGGSVAVCLFDNFSEEDYTKPFNSSLVGKAKVLKFYITDRWYGLAPDYDKIVSKMSDSDYGKPKFYNITMTNGKTYRYHHDYVIRYEHRFAPPFIKQGMLQGWGYSEGSHILNELARDEKLKGSIQSLIDKSLIEVIKMSGMRGIFMGADKQNEEQLTKRLEMVNWGRSYNSLTFLDKDDEYEMTGFQGLSGLADLLQQNMWMISSALEMQGILFGDLKGGFSTDVEALERYDETIHNRCESYVRKVHDKLLKYIYTMLHINEKPEFEYNSIFEKRHKQEKLTTTSAVIDICSKLLTDGVISTQQYAKAVRKYMNTETLDFDLTDENIEKLSEETLTMSEDFDISQDTPEINNKVENAVNKLENK